MAWDRRITSTLYFVQCRPVYIESPVSSTSMVHSLEDISKWVDIESREGCRKRFPRVCSTTRAEGWIDLCAERASKTVEDNDKMVLLHISGGSMILFRW